MKIVCSICKKSIAEQAPYKDQSIIQAKCTDCINKAKEMLSRINTSPPPEKSRLETYANGLTGRISIAGEETGKISFGELGVSGRKFECFKDNRDEFCNYLAGIDSPEVDVMFIHSLDIKIDPATRGRRKKKKTEEPSEKETITYNCTVTVSKDDALSMFDEKSKTMKELVEVLAGVLHREWQAEQAGKDVKDKT
ncbi:MAG: hypothetical protein KKD05_05155 [Candidatus Omnitrophica bacterium]|nr:hypothetical protein [Candidatus Omnitrophota bacterium]